MMIQTVIYSGFLGDRKLIKPLDLFTQNLLASKRCCLLADAYEGKTTLLQQLAHDLFYQLLKLKAVFLRLKEYSHRPLVEILDASHRWWRSVPIKEMVIIIDGLDEVDAGRFLDAVKNINELSQQFPSLPIMFSCRKLFFHHYELQNTLKGFSYYEIYPLQQQVANYISRQLAGQVKQFEKHITTYDLEHFLYHPFYLRSLVRIFKTDRQNLPKSRVATIEYFIKETFQSQEFRELKSGLILKRKQQHYLLLLKKAAFAMQLRGQNMLLDTEVQHLFPADEDIELLRVGTVLTFSHDKWSFQNAIFQEYLSALVLEQFSISRIEELVCIGKEIKKVKTKWIQTLVGLLSILSKEDDRRTELLQLLRSDNIELITLCDSQLLSPADRLDILHQLLQRYEEKRLRPMVAREDSIGRFFRNTPAAVEAMLGSLDQSATKDLKRIIWRILQFVDLPPNYWEQTLGLAKREIELNPDSEYVQDILYTLRHYQMGNQAFVEFLVEQKKLSRQLRYRDGVYDIIVDLGLGETFYDYGIEGIEIMAKTPADNFMRSEHSLEQMLLSATSVRSVTKLFSAITSDEWVDFRRSRYSGDETFMVRLAALCKQIHDHDPLMVLATLQFVRDLGYKHLRDEMKEIDQFFFQSRTESFAIRYFIHTPSSHLEWELGELLTESSFDCLFDYYEQGYIEIDLLQSLVSNAYHSSNKSVAEKFNQLYLDATGAQNFLQKWQERQREFEAYEAQKRQNDMLYIKDQASFAAGLKNYFKAHGKKSLDADAVLLNYAEARRVRSDADANVLSNFILYQNQHEKPATLSHCLKAVTSKEYFDHFRMHELLSHPLTARPDGERLLQLLNNLYNERIEGANFVTAIKQKGDNISILNWELLLSQIFEKYSFATAPHILIDMLCMDMDGINNFRTDHSFTDRKPSLSEKILEHLTPLQLQDAAIAVLQRLQNGIAVEQVFENHLALCRKLQIHQAKETILSFLLNKAVRPYHVFAVAEIFVELGGEWAALVPVLQAFEHYDAHGYFQLVSRLKDDYPDVAIASLLRAVAATSVSLEWRMSYAQTLMELGHEEGFYFFTERVRKNAPLSYGPPRHFQLKKIDTGLMLKEMSPLIPMLSEQKGNALQKDVKSLLLDLVFAIAEKGERDLLLVDALFEKECLSVSSTSTTGLGINWYRERLFENFRDRGDKPLSISEVRNTLSEMR